MADTVDTKLRTAFIDDPLTLTYRPGEIPVLVRGILDETTARLAGIAQAQPSLDAIKAFEHVISRLVNGTRMALFMRQVHPDAIVRNESTEAEKVVDEYLIATLLRDDLYDVLKASQPFAQTEIDRRLAQRLIEDFERRGLALRGEARSRARELQERLSHLGRDFENNLSEMKYVELSFADVAGVPQSVLARCEKTAQGYRVPLLPTFVVPFMEHLQQAHARKLLSEAFDVKTRDANMPLLREALDIRHELTRLFGADTWVAYRTATQGARTAQNVAAFLDDLCVKLAPIAASDIALLGQLKATDGDTSPFAPWDFAYYGRLLREREHAIDHEALRAYFPAEHVIRTMLACVEELFAVHCELESVRAWDCDVLRITFRESSAIIAYCYLDLYPRDGKYSHAAAFNLRAGRADEDGSYVVPVSASVCNFTAPQDGVALLSHDEVQTLFHEFGHILHQTLTRVQYSRLSGTQVPRDYVEVPSQAFEEWPLHPAILRRISKHAQTGEPLPDDVIDRLIASDTCLRGYYHMRQVLMSLFDFRLHAHPEAARDPAGTYMALYEQLLGIAPLQTRGFPSSFGHLMGGYDALYYSYLWSKVHALDVVEQFRREGMTSAVAGARYRAAVLETGDARDALESLAAFLGRPPSSDPFVHYLRGA
jgi:thimet oligopeptidase